MKLNTLKTNYILFHKKYRTDFNTNNLNVHLNNQAITHAKNPVLLGIILDKHMDFNELFNA